jgi:ABC-type transport system, involved in lipoprotein release, permease component
VNYKLFIAKRYLFSRKGSKFTSFITYVSIAGVALGVAALIITISIMSGFEKEIKEKVAGLVSHIQIGSFGKEGLHDYDYAMKRLREDIPEITRMSAFVQKEAVLRTPDMVEGILIKGINPETDISTTRNKILDGEFDLHSTDTNISKILIGQKLAEKLGIKVGDKIFVFGINGIPSPLNHPKIRQFRVTGLYETGLRDYDDVIVYTDIQSAQKLFELGQNVTGIEVNIGNIERADTVVNVMKNILGYPYYPKSLFTMYRGLFTWVELQKAPAPVILSLIIIVATFNIISTLLMMVLEKTQSIGILKSLGVSKTGIMSIFIYNGMLIGLTGTLIGITIGLGLSFLEMEFHFFKLPDFYYMSSVPILIDPLMIVLVAVISMSLCFIATVIPSYLASRMDPVKSIRFA